MLGIVPTSPEPIALPTRPRTPAIEPAPAPFREALPHESHATDDGLSVPELLALITAYRGSVNGLYGLSKKDLMVLLKHYQVRKVLYLLSLLTH